MINTVAGGGSFLTFSALVFVGVPPISANATSTVVVLPGYLGGTLGFRKELAEIARKRLIQFICLALVAGTVDWSFACVVMIVATLGGYGGTHLARALPKPVVRG